LNQEFSENSESLITITYKFGTIPKTEIELLRLRTSAVISKVSGLSVVEQRPIGGTLFTIASSGLGLNIMRRQDVLNYWGGGVSIIRVYDRALSADEINTNFNANKTRFGL
jgi:hypothetical protein